MQIHNEQQLIIALWAIMFTNETTELVVWRERELNEILAYKKQKLPYKSKRDIMGLQQHNRGLPNSSSCPQ